MRAEESIVERVLAGNVDNLAVVPTVGAQNCGGNAQFASLFDDFADFLIIRGHEDDIGVRGLNLRQRGFEVLIFGEESLFHDDGATVSLEFFLEDFAETL